MEWSGDTGVHMAIQVGEMVFDNLTPDGLPYEEWPNDLGGRGFIQPSGVGAEID